MKIPKRCKHPTRYVDDGQLGPLALCTKHFVQYFDSHETREIDRKRYLMLMHVEKSRKEREEKQVEKNFQKWVKEREQSNV